MSVQAARRHVDRVLSELAAEHGRVEVVREPVEVSATAYESLRGRAAAFDGCGGAGAWVLDPEGRVLLVDSDEGWAEPAAARRPEADFRDCAGAAVRDLTGVDPVFGGLSHVHVRYVADPFDRDPVPQPFVVFAARAEGNRTTGRRGTRRSPTTCCTTT
ncbi:hypothetical protein [Halosegnis marinus]|uniref:hypothetical protein n=1 Tax=Halosegnis marinus TaxID=3034023 RepID=UPI0036207F9D